MDPRTARLKSVCTAMEGANVDEVAFAVISDAMKSVGAAAAYLALSDQGLGAMLALNIGGQAWVTNQPIHMPSGAIWDELQQTGKACFDNGASASNWIGSIPARHPRIENVLHGPIRFKGEMFGLLALANKPGGFTQEDCDLVSVFSDLAAVALRHQPAEQLPELGVGQFLSVAEAVGDAIICTDSHGKVIFWNSTAEVMFGHSASETVSRPLALLNDQGSEAISQKLAGPLATGRVGLIEKALEITARRKDGSAFPAELSYSAWKVGDATNFTFVIRDITERKTSEDLVGTLAGSSPTGIYIVQRRKFEFVNPQFAKLTGYRANELVGTEAWRLVLPQDRENVRLNAIAMIKGDRTAPYEYRILTKTGETRWILETAGTINYKRQRAVVGNLLDITDRKVLEERLAYLATHDGLTRMSNRQALEDGMSRLVARARRGTSSALLFMDLDNFKVINDTLGHTAGDQALVQLAALLQSKLRVEDTMARVGGDEFGVLLDGADIVEAKLVAERIRQSVSDYSFMLGDVAHRLSVSIGVAMIDGDLPSATVFARADIMMYKAKELGGNRAMLFDLSDDAKSSTLAH